MRQGDPHTAEALANAAALAHPDRLEAWRQLGLVRQIAGKLSDAFAAYERALELDPNDIEVAKALARAALRLGQSETALALALHGATQAPGDADALVLVIETLLAVGNLSDALRISDEVTEIFPLNIPLLILRARIRRQVGAMSDAIDLLSQAQQLGPRNPDVLYELALSLADRGDIERPEALAREALALCQADGGPPSTRAALEFLLATLLLSRGALAEGWQAYGARLDPALPQAVLFDMDAPRWDGQGDLANRSLTLVAEQGLGEEIAFLGLVPDLLKRLAPSCCIELCVDKRLHGFLARSLPGLDLSAPETRSHDGVKYRRVGHGAHVKDLWLPLGDLLALDRRRIEDFDRKPGYFIADPVRVAAWRDWLASLGPGPTIGLTWRSGKLGEGRAFKFPQLGDWRALASANTVHWIALQYGATPEEHDALSEVLQAPLSVAPDLDLFQDLEGLGALCAALDLTLGVPNATTNLAGAVGAPLWMVCPPTPWTALGTGAYPWYPQAKTFVAKELGDWRPPLAAVAAQLAKF